MAQTLLDMSTLDATFSQIFAGRDATELRKKWFKQVVELFLTGALAAGCKAAFIARPDKVLNPGAPEPQFRARDATAFSEQLVQRFGGSRRVRPEKPFGGESRADIR